MTHDLLAGPHWSRLIHSWRKRYDPAATAVVVLGPQSSVDELKVLFASEQGRFIAHPDAGHDMILNQTAKGITGCRHEILVVGVGYHLRFRAGHLVFCMS